VLPRLPDLFLRHVEIGARAIGCLEGAILLEIMSKFLEVFVLSKLTIRFPVSRSPSTATITKDGVPSRAGTNQFESEDIETCSVDISLNGAVYYKVDFYTSGFVPYFSHCYP
jgi:hypothetical protein